MVFIYFFFYHLRGKGRIVDTYAVDFEALSGTGEIIVEVENTGEVSGDFSVSGKLIPCSTNITSLFDLLYRYQF